MKSIDDLIRTPDRMRIFNLISSYSDSFTTKEIFIRLRQEGYDIGISTVQTLLRALSFRDYLRQQLVRTTFRRGRSTLYFQKNSEYNLPIQ